ncbi:MAG TPA: tRNA adenosine(34) deaminase TadA [Limosilactobacillus oris]|uniref:tRNA adenosine(34) deaminase TadA n=1 Tax=Limosilactobacillus oris TaxID=1632 RepID=UPI000789F649|nr:tRNA adenosine(34) deaminase TadA [Limosilactobacillus oris]AMS08103.1 tRNA-specific adenosine deaminase [Limosilactobacillus oris]HJF46564.1 tRNA adenosine(34) deaminase TadA [Limosilactobacillus oris]
MEKEQQKFMAAALVEARQAAILNEVPIGAVVVKDNQIIGRGHNMREHFQDVTYHAEMLAIMEACERLHSWRLEDCDLYVTLEPCIMCSGAIINARIANLYYGAADPKAGAVDSLYHLLDDSRLNHQVRVESGIMQAECSQVLKDFFRAIRRRKKAARKKGRAGD